MKYSVAKLALALALVALGVAGGVLLIQYSEADDAPGGVVIGMVLIAGALMAGFMVARPRT